MKNECKKFSVNMQDIFVSLDSNNIETDFDTGTTNVDLIFSTNQPDARDPLYEIKVQMSKEFIQDTYRLDNKISEEVKVRAALDLGELIYLEKKGLLQNIENVIAQKAGARLRYIPKIDMKSIIK